MRFFEFITFSIFSLLPLVQDTKPGQVEVINQIEYHYGGTPWHDLRFTITRDSINFHEYFRSQGTMDRKVVNDDQTWDALTDAINFRTFDAIRSAESGNYIDRPDLGITIKTSLKTHTVLLNQSNRKPVETLLEQINFVLNQMKAIK